MFQVHRESDQLLRVTMSGTLDSEKMAKALDDLIEQSQGMQNGIMLFDVVNYHMPSIGAIEVELARMPAMFRFIKQFSRVAVLTDKSWIKTISELEGLLFPGVTIKGFSRDDKSSALAWLSEQYE
jgi:hypothetical protein